MTANARRKRLRAILDGETCVHPASTHDPISARLAAEIGFECGMLAGSVASLSVLGAPDSILLTLTEFAETARRIGRAADLPVIADADHGYGNALNVMRTVEELETAGIAGLTIEDTDLPRPFGDGAQALLPIEEGLGKMKAAVAARTDPDLCVFARTSALGIAGMDEALARVRAYRDTGCDGIFLTGLKTPDDVKTIAEAARMPIILGGAGEHLRDMKFLAAHGVRIVLQGHQPFAAAVAAIERTMRALRAGEPLPELASPETMDRLITGETWRRRTKAFLTPGG